MFRRPPIPTVAVQEAHRRLQGTDPSRPLLVDVRNRDEFARVRVEGAVLIPLPEFVQRFAELPADRPLLLFCNSGHRSTSATAFLLQNGFEEVANVGGGIVAWYQAGLPVVTGAPRPGEGDLPR